MTETAQPDPQVVAWMRGYLRDSPDHDYIDATNAYFIAHPYDMTKGPPGMRAAYEAARKPLTVTDIPAGQGPASLFIDDAVWFKHADGRVVVAYLRMDYDGSHAKAALWDHLAATLPHVTAEDAP